MRQSRLTIIVSCSETDPRLDPSRYFNLTANTSSVVKTVGGRTVSAINSLYSMEASTQIGMVIVLQHTGKRTKTS
ncbi:hypothetical protein K469DRAFT_652253 [Zopfia rhizophila CBS 207.26]|uniref:Uncharacterized protein n=1 Tax=Zopfia rhizophila CBS 207.26 TaxID=1314779 RepID=A0A6A6ERR0_9PEZI|nr:hypothetical protein K469DRAFT_652253 [Zopfia rhizophila CBS 207.26]